MHPLKVISIGNDCLFQACRISLASSFTDGSMPLIVTQVGDGGIEWGRQLREKTAEGKT